MRSPTVPTAMPISSAATPAFQLMPITARAHESTNGRTSRQMWAQNSRQPRTPCRRNICSSGLSACVKPSTSEKYTPGSAIKKTAAMLTRADPSQMSSRTTTQATGVALTNESAGATKRANARERDEIPASKPPHTVASAKPPRIRAPEPARIARVPASHTSRSNATTTAPGPGKISGCATSAATKTHTASQKAATAPTAATAFIRSVMCRANARTGYSM